MEEKGLSHRKIGPRALGGTLGVEGGSKVAVPRTRPYIGTSWWGSKGSTGRKLLLEC